MKSDEVFNFDDAVQDVDYDTGVEDLGLGAGLSFDLNDTGTAANLDFNLSADNPITPKLEMDKDVIASLEDNDGGDNDDNDATILGSDEEAEFIREVLARKGVVDPEKISIEDENGEIQIVSFNDLDRETQLNILSSETESDSESNFDLNENELQLVTYLRENNITVDELFERQRLQVLEELGEQVGKINFDEISDEDLYLLEMQSTYNISEDEALKSLEIEQQNPDIFAKKIEKLRSDYKEAEVAKIEEEQAAILQQQEEEYQQFGQELFEVAKSIDHIGGLTLNDVEKGEILDAVLELDESGTTKFSELFKDKNNLFRLAWFALKGEEAFEKLHLHYKEVIEQTRKEAKASSTKSNEEYKFRLSNNKTKAKTNKVDNDVFVIENHIQ